MAPLVGKASDEFEKLLEAEEEIERAASRERRDSGTTHFRLED